MTTVRFNASEIASLIGRNPYKDQQEAIVDCWNRHARKRGIDAPKLPTFILDAYKVVKKNKKSVGDLMDQIKNASNKTQTSKETFSKTIEINTKINNMELKPDEKLTLVNYAQSKMNTNYGTRKEDSVHEIYKNMTGETIGVVNKMYIKPTEGFEIGGKIDGLLDDGTVIEIKNRTRGLFSEVREYENIQVQTYLQMLEKEKGHLVECYNDGKEKHVNIIEVKRDKQYWDEVVLPGLVQANEQINSMFETKK